MRQQKVELLQTRRDNRDEAGRLKQNIQRKFEILKRKGEIDAKDLFEFGISQEKFYQIKNSPQTSQIKS